MAGQKDKKAFEEKYFSWFRKFVGKSPVIKFLVKGGLYFFLFITLAFVLTYLWVYSTVPSRTTFRNIQNATASEIYSADNELLGKYFIQDRENVDFDEISPHVINALVATEDARFYKHKGIDSRGMMRVLVKTLILGDESSGGGSTISQQLAKNLFGRKEYPFFSLPINKLREIITAQKFEDVFTKNEIITFYLNTVPFGENAFGIEVAASRYFSKTADSLQIEEAATLVGMLKGTSYYNPRRNPENSRERRNVVLDQMRKYNYLTSVESDSLMKLPLKIDYNYQTHNEGLATYFRSHLRQELEEWCENNYKDNGEAYNLYTDGLRIYTTIDSRMQQHAEKSVAEHMSRLQDQFFRHWRNKDPWGDDLAMILNEMRKTQRYRIMSQQGISEEEIINKFKEPRKMKIFTWNGPEVKTLSPWDSLRYYNKFLHAGFMAMDANTGKVRAWVGGINHEHFKYDHVNKRTKRQVGSTFKPIVYAAALEEGVDPCEHIDNERVTFEEYDDWSPRNAGGSYGGKYSLQGGLMNSVNTISAQVIMKAGINNVVSLAQRMGISSDLPAVPSLALGTADISLYEMVGAYSVFPNRGYAVEPVYMVRIEDKNGNVVKDFYEGNNKNLAMSPYNADLMVHMLQSVVDQGTAYRLRGEYGLRGPIGGKTGTTQQHADGWFIGFTPELVAGVWVGGNDRRVHFRSLSLGQGANMALPIWGRFVKKVYADPSLSYNESNEFRELSHTAELQLDCPAYIEPDTLTFWEKLFGAKKDKDTLQRDNRNRRQDNNREYGREPQRRDRRTPSDQREPSRDNDKSGFEQTVERLKNIFKRGD